MLNDYVYSPITDTAIFNSQDTGRMFIDFAAGTIISMWDKNSPWENGNDKTFLLSDGSVVTYGESNAVRLRSPTPRAGLRHFNTQPTNQHHGEALEQGLYKVSELPFQLPETAPGWLAPVYAELDLGQDMKTYSIQTETYQDDIPDTTTVRYHITAYLFEVTDGVWNRTPVQIFTNLWESIYDWDANTWSGAVDGFTSPSSYYTYFTFNLFKAFGDNNLVLFYVDAGGYTNESGTYCMALDVSSGESWIESGYENRAIAAYGGTKGGVICIPYNGKVYNFYSDTSISKNSSYVVDYESEDAGTEIANPPFSVDNGYVLPNNHPGGFSFDGDLYTWNGKTLYVYDVSSDTWDTVSTYSGSEDFSLEPKTPFVLDGNKVYWIIRDDSLYALVALCYDLSQDTWSVEVGEEDSYSGMTPATARLTSSRIIRLDGDDEFIYALPGATIP